MPAAHLIAALASSGIANAFRIGLTAVVTRKEAQAVLDRTERELALCKPWLPSVVHKTYRRDYAANRAALHGASDAAPSKATRLSMKSQLIPFETVDCSGCGRPSVKLRTCSGCRCAAYCSRECQARHWKEGGHKRECAQLAAAASSGAAT